MNSPMGKANIHVPRNPALRELHGRNGNVPVDLCRAECGFNFAGCIDRVLSPLAGMAYCRMPYVSGLLLPGIAWRLWRWLCWQRRNACQVAIKKTRR